MDTSGLKMRLIIALVVAGFSYFSYLTKTAKNPVTGEMQHISMSPEQEVAMGLQSAPQMAQEMGGELAPNDPIAQYVSSIGNKLVNSTEVKTSPYAENFTFHTLKDPETVNAFALPGGQIFITIGLLKRLDQERSKMDAEIATVLGHEIGHVIARHSAQQMAKSQLTQGLVNAATMGSGSMSGAQIAQYVGQMANLKYGRNDELQADHFGIKYSYDSGYKPENMINVMQILAKVMGNHRQPEYLSSHPNPENRIEKIREEITRIKGAVDESAINKE
jgi:beta-barrel assembly-enhancing protease